MKSEEQEKSTSAWVTCYGVSLKIKQKLILLSQCAWLDDKLINAAQLMLKERQHPLIGGFQLPVLGDSLAMIPPDNEFVQVILSCGDHWIAVSTVGCKPSTLKVCDKRSLKLVADLMQTKSLTVEFVDVQKQKGGSDCGLFALAFIASICNGQDPTKLVAI